MKEVIDPGAKDGDGFVFGRLDGEQLSVERLDRLILVLSDLADADLEGTDGFVLCLERMAKGEEDRVLLRQNRDGGALR